MARIRSIHPGLASDEAYMMMSMAAKAAWPMLWTECDDHGVFEWKPIVLKARIFPADNVDFAALLDELESLGCIRRVEHERKAYGLVRNFGRFQRPKNPSYRLPWRPEFAAFCGFSDDRFSSPPPVLPQSSPSPTENLSQMEDEGGRRKEVVRSNERTDAREADFRSAIAATYERHGHLPPETGQAVIWLKQGRDPAICCAVIDDHLARKRKKLPLTYFDGPIADAHAPPPTGEPRAPPVKDLRSPLMRAAQNIARGIHEQQPDRPSNVEIIRPRSGAS